MTIRLELAGFLSELQQIEDLYLTAFPPEERRTFEGFGQQFLQKKYIKVYLAKNTDLTLGFISLWTFDHFGFIEHFAVMPQYRGQNIGNIILKEIRMVCSGPVVLETELPLDEISARRIGFYQRNGFHLLDKYYVQPSYDGITPGPELKLMSTSNSLSTENIEHIIKTIRTNVYDC